MANIRRCGNCDKTDGLVYTSNPPMRKCTITRKFHFYNDVCDVPKTNADRIRAMSDEELVQFLSSFTRCDYCPAQPCKSLFHCEQQWLNWLQSPADGGDGDG